MTKKRVKTLLIIILTAVLAVCVYKLVRQQMDNRQSDAAKEEAVNLVKLPDPALRAEIPPVQESADEEQGPPPDPYAEALAGVQLERLQEMNEEVIGWIDIPGTEVSYPLLQDENNQYYLNHTWTREYNGNGSIFLECTNSPDFSDYHTILYGHRMRNDSMFGSLRHYKELEYWQEHPQIYVVIGDGVYRYDIFAAFEADVKGMVYYRELAGKEEEFVQYCLDNSVIDTGIVPEKGKEIVTLSTCTGNGYSRRWVVQGVLNQKYDREKAQ